jgi:glutamate synthase domain-containing protein 3
MSGGIAYVLDQEGEFVRTRCNRGGVDLEPLFDREDISLLESLIKKHVSYTGSPLGSRILDNWSAFLPKFVKVFPQDFKRVLAREKSSEQKKPAAAALPKEEVLAAREGWR